MNSFSDFIYLLPIIILLQTFVTHCNHLTPKVYYLEDLCEGAAQFTQKVYGRGSVYLARSGHTSTLNPDGCKLTLEGLVPGVFFELNLENIHLLAHSDILRITGPSGTDTRIYYDHTDCLTRTTSTAAPTYSSTGKDTTSSEDGTDGNKKNKTPGKSASDTVDDVASDQESAPYSCDGHMDTIKEDSVEIYFKESTLESAENDNFTIRYNTVVTCTTREFECEEIPQCIVYASRCDGRNNCTDGTDEKNCTDFIPCKPGYFHCLNKVGTNHCLQDSDQCDGFDDCVDGADELDCESIHFDISKSPMITASIFFGIIAIVLLATVASYKLYRRHKQKKIERYRHVTMEDLHEIVNRRDSDVSSHHDHVDDLELYSI